MMELRKTLRDRRGFSLLEVVVALGVVSVGVVAILGVLPSGLDAGRDSTSQTRAAQIAQTIVATLKAQETRDHASLFGHPMNLLQQGTLVMFTNETGTEWEKSPSDTSRFLVEIRWRDAEMAGMRGFASGEACALSIQVRWAPWEWSRPTYATLLPAPVPQPTHGP
jgi:uncharacterized protein (TIGR02598 family)